ncbi:MAG: cell division protein ZapA [Candidatus Cloacimonetes bacterium]|nr:cell division protein ZapA [Candidatus Cloacimonadota bacterium]
MKTDSKENIQQLERHINAELSKLSNRFNELDRDKLLVLFSFLLTEEYLNLKKELESLRSELTVLNAADSLLNDNL